MRSETHSPSHRRQRSRRSAKVAFAEAMSSSLVIAAVAVLGSAVLAFVLLRDRKPEATADPSSDDSVIVAH
ncbi:MULTISPECIES: hypothetical protein [Kribbella]|uniref:hypothetical protein n=1 Tax=Kribbella TaxID=182639 RepID=UPI0010485568|nr:MULTISPECIES: hypothetical protein [Kribbella]